MNLFPLVFLVIAITLVLVFFAAYVLLFKKESPVAEVYELDSQNLTYPRRRYPMSRIDILPLALIMLVYGVIAFLGLGNTTAPESFCSFEGKGNYAEFELSQDTLISKVSYYSGLNTGNYFLQFSDDGINYIDQATMEQKYSDLFKWHQAELKDPTLTAKFVRIIADASLKMGELCLFDWAGDPIPVSTIKFDSGAMPLFDEQELVPEAATYLNGAYFDEIYHVRTAQEHIENSNPYEISHPPLGKLIVGCGIRALGLNPFGWRFMGVLFGILMLPGIYVFIKNLFGSTALSVCGTLIFAFDFMHFVQTRIATIDTYGVFFILMMFLFMYRFVSSPWDDPFVPKWKANVDLFLCGLCFGLGAASKWIVLYGGAGLAIIWLLFRISRYREARKTGRLREHCRELISNILLCLVFFVIIPAIIYYVSYYAYGTAKGLSGVSMFFDKEYLNTVISNQKYMFTYHAGVVATHPYSASWYQWIVNARPILYFLEYLPGETKSAFACFMNPLVCWGGLLAMGTMAWRTVKYRDGKAAFILIGYLAQLLPWVFITRVTFEYHYFPCLIFMVLAICHLFNSFRLRDPRWKWKIYGATALCLVLFVAFYPVLTGVPVARWYSDLLAWIPGAWPF